MGIKQLVNISWPHVAALVFMVLVSVTYFYPQLQGKTLTGVDVLSGSQAAGETIEYKELTGKDYYLWSNSQFGGMPKMMWVPMKYNKVNTFFKVLQLGFGGAIGVFLAIMICGYILFVSIGANKILAVGTSAALSLATANVMLWQAGHFSKITTLALVPLILLGVYLVLDKRKLLLGFTVYVFGLSISLFQQHPQMIYYLFMSLSFVGLAYVVTTVKKGFDKSLLSGIGLLVLGTILALSVNMTRMISVYDYKKESLRGETILAQPTDQNSADEGLSYDYAMQWSSDWKDIMATYMIPGFVGGGSGEKVGVKSQSFQTYRLERAPLYWGQLPFTEGPMYVGVTMLFLLVLSLFTFNGPMKWGIAGAILFMTLASMGSHVPLLNRFLFNHLPLYNSFRAPQSILNVVLFFVPVLAVFGLISLDKMNSRKRKKKAAAAFQKKLVKQLLISTGIIIIPLLFFALLGPSILDFDAPSDQRYIGQNIDISVFKADRSALLRRDALRSILLVLIMAGTLYYYIKGKLKSGVLYTILAALLIFDIWGVSSRYLSHDDFRTKTAESRQNFAARPVDTQIKTIEPDRSKYRVQDLTIDTYNSSQTSYFHNTIGGYDPAKLRRFQDVYQRYLTRNNQAIYDMLNTKYFIVNSGQGPGVQQNTNALGNAWFVNEIIEVNSPDEEFNALENFNPSVEAVVNVQEFSQQLSDINLQFDSLAKIELTYYEPDRLVYKTSSESDQLAVFSEIWYKGNSDWVSYIDGKRADHLRVNYLLRGMVIPQGVHEVVFEFKPKAYALGESVSRVSWWALMILLIGVIIYYVKPYIGQIRSANG